MRRRPRRITGREYAKDIKIEQLDGRVSRIERDVELMRAIVDDPLLDPARLEWLADSLDLLDSIADAVSRKMQLLGPGVAIRRDAQAEIRQLAVKVTEYRERQQGEGT